MKKLNMTMKRKGNWQGLLLLLVFLISGNAQAQNFKEDMGKIAANYRFGGEMEMKMHYNFYSAGKIVESFSTHVVYDRNRFYLNTKNLEVVNGGGIRVMAAHESREIIVMPEQAVESDQVFNFSLDSIKIYTDTFFYKKEGPARSVYTVIFKGESKDRLEIYFDPASFEISKVKKYSRLYNEGTGVEEPYVLEITIESYYRKVLSPEKLSFEKFVVKNKNKKWQLSNLYKNYNLEDFSVTKQ